MEQENINLYDQSQNMTEVLIRKVIKNYNSQSQQYLIKKNIIKAISKQHRDLMKNGILPTSINALTSQQIQKGLNNMNSQQEKILNRLQQVQPQRSQSTNNLKTSQFYQTFLSNKSESSPFKNNYGKQGTTHNSNKIHKLQQDNIKTITEEDNQLKFDDQSKINEDKNEIKMRQSFSHQRQTDSLIPLRRGGSWSSSASPETNKQFGLKKMDISVWQQQKGGILVQKRAHNDQYNFLDASPAQTQTQSQTQFKLQQQKTAHQEQSSSPTINTKLLDGLTKKLEQFVDSYTPLQQHSKLLIDISGKKWDDKLHFHLEKLDVDDFFIVAQDRLKTINIIQRQSIVPEIERLLKEKFKLDGIKPSRVQIDIINLINNDIMQLIDVYKQMIINLKLKMGLKTDENESRSKEQFFNDFVNALRLQVLLKSYFNDPEQKKVMESIYSDELGLAVRNMKYLDTDVKVREYLEVFKKVDKLMQELIEKSERQEDQIEQLTLDLNNIRQFCDNNLIMTSQETSDCLQKYKANIDQQQGIRKTIGSLDLIEETQKHTISKMQKHIARLEAQNKALQEENLSLSSGQEAIAHAIALTGGAPRRNQLNQQTTMQPQSQSQSPQVQFQVSLETQNSELGQNGLQTRTKRQKLRKVETIEKGVQVEFVQPILNQRSQGLPRVLPAFLEGFKDQLFGYTFTQDCSNAMLNLILSQKLLVDYEDYQLGISKQCLTMKDFLGEFFLTLFGNCSLAEIFMRDFIESIYKYSNPPFSVQRYKTMNLMLGVLCPEEKLKLQTEQQIKASIYVPERFQYKFFESLSATTMMVKMAFICRFAMVQEEESFKPTCPNYLMDDEELVPNDVAQDLSRIILREEGLNKKQMDEFLLNYSYFLQQDVVERRKTHEMIKKTHIDSHADLPVAFTRSKKKQLMESGIRFDALAKNLLEFMALVKQREISLLATSIRVVQQSRDIKDLSVNDFINAIRNTYQMSRHDRWIIARFNDLVVKNERIETLDVYKMLDQIYFNLIDYPLMGHKFYIDLVQNGYFENLIADITKLENSSQHAVQLSSPMQGKKGMPKKARTLVFSQVPEEKEQEDANEQKDDQIENATDKKVQETGESSLPQKALEQAQILEGQADQNSKNSGSLNQSPLPKINELSLASASNHLTENSEILDSNNQQSKNQNSKGSSSYRKMKSKHKTHISAQQQSKAPVNKFERKDERLKKNKRSVFKFNMEGYCEIAYSKLKMSHFDVVSSIIVLEECYYYLTKVIQRGELKSEAVQMLHAQFREQMEALPKKLRHVKMCDQYLAGKARWELILKVESAWGAFRSLVDHSFSKVGKF